MHVKRSTNRMLRNARQNIVGKVTIGWRTQRACMHTHKHMHKTQIGTFSHAKGNVSTLTSTHRSAICMNEIELYFCSLSMQNPRTYNWSECKLADCVVEASIVAKHVCARVDESTACGGIVWNNNHRWTECPFAPAPAAPAVAAVVIVLQVMQIIPMAITMTMTSATIGDQVQCLHCLSTMQP